MQIIANDTKTHGTFSTAENSLVDLLSFLHEPTNHTELAVVLYRSSLATFAALPMKFSYLPPHLIFTTIFSFYLIAMVLRQNITNSSYE